MKRRQALTGAVLGLALLAGAATPPVAQEQSGGAMQGFALSGDQPVKIEANALEVRDKIRQATFSGDVKLTQGDTTLKCRVLVVFYEDTAMSGSKKSAQNAPQGQKGGGGQQIKRAEAKGEVFVTQKDQTASGDLAIYDAKANTITMTGNVVVTQGSQVMRGERMIAYLATGVTQVDSGNKVGGGGTGRIELLLIPGAKDAKGNPAMPAPQPAPAAKAPPGARDVKAAPPAAKAAPGAPVRIN